MPCDQGNEASWMPEKNGWADGGRAIFLMVLSKSHQSPLPNKKEQSLMTTKTKYKQMSAIARQVLLVWASLSPYQSDWRSMNYAESIESLIFPTFHLWVTPQELYLQRVDTQREKLS